MIFWLNIIIILLVLSGAITFLFCLNRRWLIKDINSLFNKASRLLAESIKFSQENSFVLDSESKKLAKLLNQMQKIIKYPPKNIELENFYLQSNENYQQIKTKINQKRADWIIYLDFKERLPVLKATIKNKLHTINQKTQQLIFEHQEQETEINREVEQNLVDIKGLLNEYKLLDRSGFRNFDFDILDYLEKDHLRLMDKAENICRAIAFFKCEFKVLLKEIARDTNFYLILESINEEQRNTRRYKEILVSYKGYRRNIPGKNYDRQFIVQKRRISSRQKIILQFEINQRDYFWEQELSNQEFAELFRELKIGRNKEKVDQEGLPFKLKETNLDLMICSKEAGSFTIEYQNVFFRDINIYKLLDEILNKNSPEIID